MRLIKISMAFVASALAFSSALASGDPYDGFDTGACYSIFFTKDHMAANPDQKFISLIVKLIDDTPKRLRIDSETVQVITNKSRGATHRLPFRANCMVPSVINVEQVRGTQQEWMFGGKYFCNAQNGLGVMSIVAMDDRGLILDSSVLFADPPERYVLARADDRVCENLSEE